MNGGPGTLYVVATPIGHLDDLTVRAATVLRQVPLVAAEDSRRALILLKHIGSAAPITAYDDHAGNRVRQKLLRHLLSGQDIALISAAGTPLISDPGYRLVCEAVANEIPLVPIPGASAVIAALSVAGLATDRFVFEGFPPRAAARRKHWLAELKRQPRTSVLFESGVRLPLLLRELCEVLGKDRPAVLAQELSKVHERFAHLSLGEMQRQLSDRTIRTKGEAVLLIAGHAEEASAGAGAVSAHSEALLQAFLEVCPPAEAARRVAALTAASRKELYRLAKESKKSKDKAP